MQQKLEIKLMNTPWAEPRQSQRRFSEACDLSLGTALPI
jgi:hypothetical protein